MVLVAKGGGILLAGKVFTYVGRFAAVFILVRLMTAPQYGQYNLGLTTAEVLAGLAALGLPTALVRFLPHLLRRGDRPGFWGTLQVCLGLTVGLSILLAGGLFVSAETVAKSVFHDANLAPVLRLVAVFVPFFAASDSLAAATRGFKAMQYTTIAQLISHPLVKFALIATAAVVGLTPALAIAASGLAEITVCLMLFHFLKNLAKGQKTVEASRRETGTILRYSLPVYFASLLDDFSGQLQVLLLGTLSTTAQVGVYALTREVSKLSELFQRSITMPAQPLMSELFSRNSRLEFNRFYRSTTRWTFALNLPVFLIFALLPGPVLSVFGSTFASGVVILWMLIAQRLLYVATGMCATVLDMSGHTRLKLLNSAIRLVMLTGLNLWLIPRWGALGAALAAFFTTSVVGLLRLAQVGFLFRVLPYDGGFVKTVFAAGIAWLVGLGVGRLIPPNGSALNAVVNGILIVAVYVVAVFVLGLAEEEQLILARARRRAGSIMARFAPGRAFSGVPRQKTQKAPEPAPQLEAEIPGTGQ